MLVSEKIDIEYLAEKYRTPQGIYIIDGVSASAGVLPYVMAENGKEMSVGIFTSPDELFKSIHSLIGVPAVKEHPTDFHAEISDMKGIVLNAYIIGDWNIGVSVGLWGDDLLDYITRGNYELSAGYTAEIVKSDGEWYGSPYGYEKKNIVYNHLAIVERGTARNGMNNKLLIDSNRIEQLEIKENYVFNDSQKSSVKVVDFNHLDKTTQVAMKKITFIGVDGHNQTAEVDPDVYQYVIGLEKSQKSLQTKLQDSQTEIATIPSINENLQSTNQQLQDAKTSIADLEKEVEATKKMLPSLLKIAIKAQKLGVDINFDDFDSAQIMRKALEGKYPEVENLSVETLEYLFNITEPTSEPEKDSVKDSAKSSSLKKLLNGVPVTVQDSNKDKVLSSEDLSDSYIKRLRTAKAK